MKYYSSKISNIYLYTQTNKIQIIVILKLYRYSSWSCHLMYILKLFSCIGTKTIHLIKRIKLAL